VVKRTYRPFLQLQNASSVKFIRLNRTSRKRKTGNTGTVQTHWRMEMV